MGGGFFAGRYSSSDQQVEPGSRFDPSRVQGKVGVITRTHLLLNLICVHPVAELP